MNHTTLVPLEKRSGQDAAHSRPTRGSGLGQVGGRLLRFALVVALSLLLLGLPFSVPLSILTTAVFVLIAAIGATGLNLLTGFAGQISLGHAFFLAVGAYTFVQGERAGVASVHWILVAGAVAAAIGALVGPIALRLRGLYLAIVTMGLIFVGQHVFFNAPDLTGGPEGRAFPALTLSGVDFAVDAVSLGPYTVESNGLYYYTALLVLAACTAFAWNLKRSRAGRAMAAVRDRPDAARLAGIRLAATKTAAFALSAFMAGVCGALYASYVGYAQPGQWDLMFSIQFIAAIVVGGLGSISGPILGSAVVFALPTVLNDLASNITNDIPTGAIASVVYGSLIVIFLLAEPRGLAGIAQRTRQRWRRPDPVPEGPPDPQGEP